METPVSESITARLAAQASPAADRSFYGHALRQLSRMRFQMAFGLIAAVAIPAVLRTAYDGVAGGVVADATMFATIWSFLFGFLIFHKVTAFPGVRAIAYILPTFVAAYAITALALFLLRIEYSRLQLGASFALSTAFFFGVFFVMRRARKVTMALIPTGDVQRVSRVKFVEWRQLKQPADDDGALPIVADLHAALSPEWERFIADAALAGRPVYNVKQVLESLTGRVQIQHLSENRFGSLLPDSIYASAKRYCDLTLALIVLGVAWPVLLIVGLIIRLDSPGPALFRQARIGQGGRLFTVFKFRTMREASPGADQLQAQMTRDNDPRITGFGKWLRASRFDELPQLLNILKGDMSWIGPRPEAQKLGEWYEASIPFYRYRHIVRPGITGWAQVNQGHVTSLEDADVKLQYDFFYVKNFSLWLDLLVLLRTFKVMVTGHGAR